MAHTRQMKLGFSIGSIGYHYAAWRLPEAHQDGGLSARHYIESAQLAERGKFDFVFVADVAAIRHLLLSDQLQHAVPEPVEIGVLAAYERPLPTMIEYDRLFSGTMQAVQA